jgi:hypothetical protein
VELFGDNADWMIDLADKTLFDFLDSIKFLFTKQGIIDSWQFDGTDERLPYVFAPVRYSDPMGNADSRGVYDDYNMLPEYMKPSISKYWIIYWAFKSLGYRIKSNFLNLPFFRRQVMPWTWGAFLNSDGTRLDNLKFLARSDEATFIHITYTGYWDLNPSNDKTTGGFDNNNVYEYDGINYEMKFSYLQAFNYGNLDGFFELKIYIDAVATDGGDNHLWVEWYQEDSRGIRTKLSTDSVFVLEGTTRLSVRRFTDIVTIRKKVNINPGDKVIAKIFIRNFDPNPLENLGRANITAQIESFELAYFRIPIGTGTIDFQNFTAFKNYKFLDFLRGVVDEFNLSFKTDASSKVILIEPTHPYTIPGEAIVRPGFFNNDFIDWSGKLDLSQKASLKLFSDYNRVLNFRYKADSNDSLQKIVQDRNAVVLASSRYLLPLRFQTGNNDFENRFFSYMMHYNVSQWKDITGLMPQMPCLVSENSSNTSPNFQSQSTLTPKSAYYKGLMNGIGWVFDGKQDDNGKWIEGVMNFFPYLFSVNYMPGGEKDPVLSYTDEKIGDDSSGYVIAKGLLKVFFLQRLANIRNGQWHEVYFRLNNYDVAQPWHREFKTYFGQKWELIQITGFKPLSEVSTKCLLRKWVPIAKIDNDSIYPSLPSIVYNTQQDTNDLKYNPLKCLPTDIPK